MMTPYKKRKEAIFPGPAPGGALATVASSGVFFLGGELGGEGRL